MSIATYDTAVPACETAATTASAKRSFWLRMFDRLVEVRMRQAEQYIARHRQVLDTFERPTATGEQAGPTGR